MKKKLLELRQSLTKKVEEAKRLRLYNVIGKAMDKLYLQAIKKQVLNSEVIKEEE